MHQRIRFCRTADGVRLAYATHGAGPPLVKVAHWMTHLEHDWASPVWQHWLDELGRRHLVVRYDSRDTGLSDRDVPDVSLDAWVRDLEAVVDDAGVDRFALFAMCQAEVHHHGFAVRPKQDIARLQVAVDHSPVVCLLHRQGELADQQCRLRRGEALACVQCP